MARKLGIGGSVALFACVVLAGCQTGTGSRVASNNTKSPAVAKQGVSLPAPYPPTKTAGAGFPGTTNHGLGSLNNPAPNNFPTSGSFPPSSNGLAPAGGAPAGPAANSFPPPPTSSFGPATTTNRTNNVTITQPDAPVPMIPPPPSNFADPGISPLPPPPTN